MGEQGLDFPGGGVVLTDAKVTRARINAEGWTYQQWADLYGEKYNTMYHAITGRTFRHLETPPRKFHRADRRLTPEQVREIRINRRGLTFEQLGQKYGLSLSAVRYVFHGRTYQEVA